MVQLTDDNLDGQIDEMDVPDVIFTHGTSPLGFVVISAVDGATGADLFRITDLPGGRNPLAAGDLDNDGVVEILVMRGEPGKPWIFRLLASEHTGALK